MSIKNQVMQNKTTGHGSPVVKRLLICTYTFHKRDTSLLAGKIGSAATDKIFSFYRYRDYSSEKKSDKRYRTRYLRLVRLSVNAFRCKNNRNGLKDGLTQA